MKSSLRRILRPRGLEVRRFDPDISLDTYLWTLFRHYDVNCVLDVGARIGDYGVLLRENGYSGSILSFEPVSANYAQLTKVCEKDPDWKAYQWALGSESGSAEINVTRGSNYSSFLAPSEYGKETSSNIAVAHTETVAVKRLDAVFDEVTAHVANPRVYLKMDTQGFDLEVLRGAKGCLSRVVALQSELSLRPLYTNMVGWSAAIAEFEGAGYAVSALFAGFRDSKLRLSEMDCVMVRNE